MHYVMVSRIQWKPFWLSIQLNPQKDRTGWQNGVNDDVCAQASLDRVSRQAWCYFFNRTTTLAKNEMRQLRIMMQKEHCSMCSFTSAGQKSHSVFLIMIRAEPRRHDSRPSQLFGQGSSTLHSYLFLIHFFSCSPDPSNA